MVFLLLHTPYYEDEYFLLFQLYLSFFFYKSLLKSIFIFVSIVENY